MKRYKDPSGSIAKQISDVEIITRDWNCDGDIYPIEGVWVEWEKLNRREFIPLHVVEDYFKEI